MLGLGVECHDTDGVILIALDESATLTDVRVSMQHGAVEVQRRPNGSFL